MGWKGQHFQRQLHSSGSTILCALQVPKIVRCIYENMECIHTVSVRHSLALLLLVMTDQCPREVVTSLLKLSPSCDRY